MVNSVCLQAETYFRAQTKKEKLQTSVKLPVLIWNNDEDAALDLLLFQRTEILHVHLIQSLQNKATKLSYCTRV